MWGAKPPPKRAALVPVPECKPAPYFVISHVSMFIFVIRNVLKNNQLMTHPDILPISIASCGKIHSELQLHCF